MANLIRHFGLLAIAAFCFYRAVVEKSTGWAIAGAVCAVGWLVALYVLSNA